MKTYLLVIAGLALFISLSAENGIEYLTPDTIYYKEVQEGDPIQGKIEFINRSSGPVRLINVRTSCGCTVADFDRDPIQPGDQAQIPYIWKTRGFKDHSTKTITLEFAQGDIPSKMFMLDAQIDYYIQSSPMYISFRNVHAYQDTVIDMEFAVINKLNRAITIQDVVSMRHDSDEAFPHLELDYEKKKVKPGERFTGVVRFRPHESMRLRGKLSVITKEKVYKPVVFNLYARVDRNADE